MPHPLLTQGFPSNESCRFENPSARCVEVNENFDRIYSHLLIADCSSLFFLFYDNHNASQSPHYSATSISSCSSICISSVCVCVFFSISNNSKNNFHLLSHFLFLQRLTRSLSGPLAPRRRLHRLWRPTRTAVKKKKMFFITELLAVKASEPTMRPEPERLLLLSS